MPLIGKRAPVPRGLLAALTARGITADQMDTVSDVVFVDGFAPIIPLLVAQFEQALDRRPLGQRTIMDAAVRDGIVDVELRGPCRLQITAYRRGALNRTHEKTLVDRDVEPGTHSAALGPRATRSRNAFVVIRAGDETAALPVD